MKTAIVGAGINGLYLARKLAQKKEKITVFEKKEKIGKKICSGLFSEKILKFIPESKKLISNEINSVLIHFPKRSLKVNFSEKFLVINHFDLDNLAADLAEKAGAKIILGKKDVKKEVLLGSFDRIIGCDGPASVVRKWLGLPDQNFYLGIQGFLESDDPNSKIGSKLSYVETWPTKKGFVWKIPRGEKIEWGIMEEPKKAKPIFENFLKKKSILLTEVRSSLIPQSLPLLAPCSFFQKKEEKDFIRRTTLCGDAAGLTKPWSGGGVIWGLTAADLLLKSFPDFLRYRKKIKRFFLPKIIFSKIACKTIYFLGFNAPCLIPKNTKIESDFLF